MSRLARLADGAALIFGAVFGLWSLFRWAQREGVGEPWH